TEPWGISDQPWFLNAVVQFESKGTPEDALATCLSIEEAMGRKRILKWGERLIDIDILFFNEQIVETETLSIPHPGIPDRRFALLPLVEKWPDEIHPSLQQTMHELLVKSTDTLKCTIVELKF
ncbi:MAG: 2-amino-4-hydroxy-6-hydroxymethyldihydropteridine diphosphokinase, partial [Cyclobacteriaceae bacterium]